ncbi:MAG TPA: hypothetical protein PKA24_17420, partial [Microthrixaceae bacterium]|nr:hypothetical protein [Microthrixaceae bacterium]
GGVAFGVASGVASGVAFGVAEGVASGVAGGVAFGVAIPHLVLAPAHLAGFSVSRFTGSARAWHPLWWDRNCGYPLPGLRRHLRDCWRADPSVGIEAFRIATEQQYQQTAARQAAFDVIAGRMLRCNRADDLVGLARDPAFALTELLGRDTAEHRAIDSAMKVLHDITAAFESVDPRARLDRLTTAQARARSAVSFKAETGTALTRWDGILETEIRSAEATFASTEPIPNVFLEAASVIAANDTVHPFVGRNVQLADIDAALTREQERQMVVLLGGRRSGKTSLLERLYQVLGADDVPAVVDLLDASITDAAGGRRTYLGNLAERIADVVQARRDVTLPTPDPAGFATGPLGAFASWLNDVETALGFRRLLVCIDEYEALDQAINDGLVDAAALKTLRSHGQRPGGRIQFMFAGVHPPEALGPVWSDALVSTLTIRLPFFDHDQVAELLRAPDTAGYPHDVFRPDAVERVHYWTGGQPATSQTLAHLTVKRVNRQIVAGQRDVAHGIAAADVDAAVDDTLDSVPAIFANLYNAGENMGGVRTEEGRRLLVALSLAPEFCIVREPVSAGGSDEQPFRRAVGELRHLELIAMTDTHITLTMRLLGRWIQRQRDAGQV